MSLDDQIGDDSVKREQLIVNAFKKAVDILGKNLSFNKLTAGQMLSINERATQEEIVKDWRDVFLGLYREAYDLGFEAGLKFEQGNQEAGG